MEKTLGDFIDKPPETIQKTEGQSLGSYLGVPEIDKPEWNPTELIDEEETIIVGNSGLSQEERILFSLNRKQRRHLIKKLGFGKLKNDQAETTPEWAQNELKRRKKDRKKRK